MANGPNNFQMLLVVNLGISANLPEGLYILLALISSLGPFRGAIAVRSPLSRVVDVVVVVVVVVVDIDAQAAGDATVVTPGEW